jgi:ferredoxin
MRIRVIDERCQGHGRCYVLAPELIESDDLGNAHVIGDGAVTDDLAHRARLAARNCPEDAIDFDG